MSQGLVTYIVLGSEERLKTLKLPVSNKEEEYLFANFSNNISYEKMIITKEEHGFSNEENREASMERLLKFFNKYL